MQFSHGGRDEGFDAALIAYAETGQGAGTTSATTTPG